MVSTAKGAGGLVMTRKEAAINGNTPAPGGAPRDDFRAARAKQEIRELKRQATHLQEAIDAMERTSIWRLGEKWYAVRRFLARAGRGPASPPRRAAARTGGMGEPVHPPPRSAAAPRGGKVLFISHDAHRMRAPILLLNFLRWFKEHAGIPFEILLGDDGELRPEFEALAPVTLWREDIPIDPAVPHAIRMLERAGRPRRWARAGLGLIYSNTITNGRILDALSGLGCPVISHVHKHELDWSISGVTLSGNNEQVKRLTTRYIAVSEAVKAAVVRILGVPGEVIDVIHPFVPPYPGDAPLYSAAKRVREALGIPPGAWVVGAVGTTDWRKGADLFAHLARAVRRLRPERPVHFVWVGGDGNRRTMGALAHDLRHLGLDAIVHFIGAVPNPLDYYAAFDVFALMSREDPCPLVMLEAASLGKPILCFEGSGGAPEFVGEECGCVVPYLDLEEMAGKALTVLRSPALRESMGRAGMERVRARHDLAVVAPRILAAIRRCMDGT